MYTRKSDLLDHPGNLVLEKYTIEARRKYRRASRLSLKKKQKPITIEFDSKSADLDENEMAMIEQLEQVEMSIFWGGLAIMDRKKTTIQALLDLQPGCSVDNIDPSLFDFFGDSVAAHTRPKKRQPASSGK